MPTETLSQPSTPIVYKAKTRLAWVGQGLLIVIVLTALVILVINFIRDPVLFIQIVIGGLQLGFVYALIA